MNEQKLELLNKLKALANDTRGNDNERKVAMKQLEILMERYNITEEDLGKTERKERTIWFHSEWERRLANQVCYKLFPTISRYSHIKDRRHMHIELTDAEWIEFEYIFNIYRNDFEKELDLFFIAFLQKNHIFPDVDKDPDGPTIEDKYSKGDLLRIGMMMEGIEHSQIRKAIGEVDGEN